VIRARSRLRQGPGLSNATPSVIRQPIPILNKRLVVDPYVVARSLWCSMTRRSPPLGWTSGLGPGSSLQGAAQRGRTSCRYGTSRGRRGSSRSPSPTSRKESTPTVDRPPPLNLVSFSTPHAPWPSQLLRSAVGCHDGSSGAHAELFVYDVTNAASLEGASDTWMR
jgi:hypothetical protein